jgi:predicted ABC-type ATPase
VPSRKPTIYIFGGSNGVGKTTFAKEFLREKACSIRFLNADEIARGLSPLNPSDLAMKAGRILLEEIGGCIVRGKSFGIESTLSGKTYVRLLENARAGGFEIELHYLCVKSPQEAIERIKERVRQGGHNVPKSDVLRRFTRSLENLIESYLPLADRWFIWNNENFPAKPIASSKTHNILQVKEMLSI